MTALALRASQAARAPLPTSLRLGVLVACTLPAFWFSLGALVGQWRYETPLADLALVPLLTLVTLVAACRRHPYVSILRLGWFDLLLGAALIAIALMLLATGPAIWSKYFWAMRIDMLALPLFVGGGVLLLFGARAIVPFGFPVLSLLLAWPLPYQALLERELAAFTQLTSGVVAAVAPRFGLARPLPGSDGAFALTHGSKNFTLSIGSACSGVNSLLGFLLLAAFALFFLEGLPARRLAWLALGVILVWAANVLRILVLFAVGRSFGERAAVAILHPIAGLLALNLAVALLLRLMPRFHLFWRELEPVHADTPLAQPGPPERRGSLSRLAGRITLLGVATIALALADGQLATAARGLTNDGLPAIGSFAAHPQAAPGWTIRRSEAIGWASPYYGQHSSWIRYTLRPSHPGRRAFTIWLDAVRSPDLGALDAYTLAHCYAFHGFTVDAARHVALGNGVVGQSFVYTTGRADWHALSWEWPVRGSSRTEHERIVLLASSAAHPATKNSAVRGVNQTVLWLLDFRQPNADPNATLTRALARVASALVAERVRAPR